MSYAYPPQASAPAPYPPGNPNGAYPPTAAYPPVNNAAYPPVNNAAYPPVKNASYPPTNPYPPTNSYPPTSSSVPAATYPENYGKPNKTDGIPILPPGYDPNQPMPTSSNENHRFEPPNGPQDLWAAILFLAQFAGFIVLTVLSVPKIDFATFTLKSPTSGTTRPPQQSSGMAFKSYTIIAMVGAAIVALALSVAYLFAMRKWPKQLIKFTFWISIAMCFIMGGLSLLTGQFITGIIMVIVGVLYIVFYRAYKARMPFAAVMLETVSDVTMKYPGTIYAGVIGLIVQLAYVALWGITAISAMIVFGQATTTTVNGRTTTTISGVVYVLFVYLLFSFYWSTQVIKNTLHVTVSGVFASFFFLSGTPQGMPASPTAGAFKRIIITSFGSISYGSLLIAIIQTIRTVIRSLAQESDSLIGVFIACCIDCILGWIESLAEIFNFYALTQVAIYGKDFCRAAKDTWTLIKDRGIEALINDSLIDNVLGFGGFIVGVISLGAGWAIYAIGAATSTGTDGALILVLIVSFLAGFVMFDLISGVISSGVATTFVCLAEDPAALRATKPELFQRIVQTYPDAQLSMYS